MDARRRRNRDRLGALHSVSRAQAKRLTEPLAPITSPRRGEVGSRRLPGEGVTTFAEASFPPHPIPLPCGERESAADHAPHISRQSLRHVSMYDNLLANVPTDLYIGGQWRAAADKDRF